MVGAWQPEALGDENLESVDSVRTEKWNVITHIPVLGLPDAPGGLVLLLEFRPVSCYHHLDLDVCGQIP